MHNKLRTVLVLGLLASPALAIAENVSIPCEEFAKTTGKRLACDNMPVIRMPAGKWEKEKAASAARNAPDANVPPWEREAKPNAQPKGKTIADVEPCSVPPWKRPEGAKCD